MAHDEELDPREAARARKRDRRTSAAARAGMRSGAAKHLRQITDAIAKRAVDGPSRRKPKDRRRR